MASPVTPDPVPQAKQHEILPENLNRLHDVFKLFDPQQQGLGLDKVRTIFPKEGWHYILQHVDALVEAGRLTKRPVTGKGGLVSHDTYTWQEGSNG